MGKGRNFLIHKVWDGGRAGTRTPDLLRVKRVVGFFWLPDFYAVLITFNNMGSLLFAQSASPTAVKIEF